MKEDDSLEDDALTYEPSSITITERDRKHLRNMQGGAIVVDLDWYPEQYDDWDSEDGEPELPDRETYDCQATACGCMSEIGNLDAESDYERMAWNQEMAYHSIVLIPIEIHMVQGPTGTYPRFWGYICQYYPEAECWGAKKATISLPSGLSKRISVFNEKLLEVKVNPLEDSTVHMILTTYHGLEEFETKNGEKRKAHKFWETRLIQGHRSPQ
jgi:hypothetical protein